MAEPLSCEHDWQPVSFRFETQLLDSDGRVQIRQPAVEDGRVYVVCMRCHSHSYIETRWVGYYIVADRHLDAEGNDVRQTPTKEGHHGRATE